MVTLNAPLLFRLVSCTALPLLLKVVTPVEGITTPATLLKVGTAPSTQLPAVNQSPVVLAFQFATASCVMLMVGVVKL